MNKFLKTLSAFILFIAVTTTTYAVQLGHGLGDAFNRSIFIEELAAADADIAGQGQIWVKNTTPNELWFTDDAGTDAQLGAGGGGGSDLQTTMDSGDDWTIANSDNQTSVWTNNDTTNDQDTLQIVSPSGQNGRALFIDYNGTGTSNGVLYVDAESSSGAAIRADKGPSSGGMAGYFYESSSNYVEIANSNGGSNGNTRFRRYATNPNGPLANFDDTSAVNSNGQPSVNVKSSYSGGAGLLVDKNNSDYGLEVDLDANDAIDSGGIYMNITNAGAGEEFAFSFNGSEYGTGTYTNAVVTSDPDGYITIDVAGTTYYMPIYSTLPQ